MKISHKVQNTGKDDVHRLIFFVKKRNSITVAVLDLKFCMLTGFLVHRHTIFPLTFYIYNR